MDFISKKDFIVRQPSFPEWTDSDDWYLGLASDLVKIIEESGFGKSIPGSLVKRIALTLADYMQDIVADGGLWRSFVMANRELYGYSVPFHDIPEEYVDFELNREDVRFLCWYAIAMLWDEMRGLYPHNSRLLEMADRCYEKMSDSYDEAPVPVGYKLAHGLEYSDPGDKEAIYNLGQWLFLHSYLLTPAFALTLQEIMAALDKGKDDFDVELNKALETSMTEATTGPLALFLPEWIWLMIKGRLPKESIPSPTAYHPYYEKFTKATGGELIRFFENYEEMNAFFISALGWEKGVEHLSQVKGASDYVLMVNPHKGMLMAKDIAKCIKAPQNYLYDAAYAREHSFELLSRRGACPGDLLRMLQKENWLPDAVFPGTDDTALVQSNYDFIARCYLQLFYRGD